MQSSYYPSVPDVFFAKVLKRLSITDFSEISLVDLSKKLNIQLEITELKSYLYVSSDIRLINLNSSLNDYEKKKTFFYLLAKLLNGEQSKNNTNLNYI